MSVSLGMCMYLQWYRPFADNFLNHIEAFNEATMLALTYFLFCFTDFVPDAETRYKLGFAYIATSFVNLAVHMVIMLRGSFIKVRQSCRKFRHNRRIKQVRPSLQSAQPKRTMEPED